MKNKNLLTAAAIASVMLFSCTKDLELENQDKQPTSSNLMASTSLSGNGNPFSISNINNALADLGRGGEALDPDRIYHYYQFDITTVSSSAMTIIAEDDNNLIQDFPFGDASVYENDHSEDWESFHESLIEDGKHYISFKANSPLEPLFNNSGLISATKIDELYLPDPDDEDLHAQALANAANVTLGWFKINWPCLFKRPKGKIRYRDVETNTLKGVPGLQVWAIHFGIPIFDYTDNYGNYEIPALFSVGTYLGIKAENSLVKVRPINTVGTWHNAAVEFIGGANKSFGWYTSCDMKNNINYDYSGHNQQRLWCHILDAVHLHQGYAAQDGILSAPSNLVWYANWDSQTGSASAPMLGHFSTSPSTAAIPFISLTLGTSPSSANQSLFNAMTSLLPDITSKTSNNESNYYGHYSEAIMQTFFHELGHASLFNKVGQQYWDGVIHNIVVGHYSPCGFYGCGTEAFWGLTQINESWAEFIGKVHHQRLHPQGQAYVQHKTGGPGYYNYPAALEDVEWFANNWINTGIYWDVMDGQSSSEPDDNIQGYTISQMYNCFNSTTEGFCDWRDEFLSQNPSVSFFDLHQLMQVQNGWNNTCSTQWPGPLFTVEYNPANGPLLQGAFWGR